MCCTNCHAITSKFHFHTSSIAGEMAHLPVVAQFQVGYVTIS